MRNIEAEIVADSINPAGKRITTFLLTYPRFIHSELMTHRMFSRNAASSRAIPVEKVMESVRNNPAHPEHWGANKAGMQADEQLEGAPKVVCEDFWSIAAKDAMHSAQIMVDHGLHKQVANRILEPWFHITVLVTATEWDNFFSLRAHPAAQPEFQVLAYRMLDKYLNNKPLELDWGEWHVPFAACEGEDIDDALVQSVASAARTSYTTHDGDFPIEKQCELVERLAKYGHWSPFEHQAQATEPDCTPSVRSNFHPTWTQYRILFPKQNRENVDLKEIMNTKPEWVTL